jgi:myxalamid-type nonribosomal peptide synthetase MxaA
VEEASASLDSISVEEKRSLLAKLLSDSPGVSGLTAAQQRVWFLQQLDDAAPMHVFAAYRINGPLKLDRLQRAFADVVRRYDVLRSTVIELDGRALRTVSESSSAVLPVITISGGANNELELAEQARQFCSQAFRLDSVPLIRAQVIEYGPLDWVLMLAAHELAADERSLRRVGGEIFGHYRQDAASGDVGIEQFADFVRQEQQYLATDDAEESIRFWSRHLAGVPALRIPSSRIRPARKSFDGGSVSATIEPDVLERYAEAAGVRPASALLALYVAILSRFATQDDLAVGVARALEPSADTVVGPTQPLLPVRLRPAGQHTWTDLALHVRDALEEISGHRRVPLSVIVDRLNPRRDVSTTPFFQAGFEWIPEPQAEQVLDLLVTRLDDLPPGVAPLDVSVAAWQEAAGPIRLRLDYNRSVVDEAMAHRMAEGLATLGAQAAASPRSAASRTALLSTRDLQTVTEAFNETPAVEVPAAPVHELVVGQARRTPGASAVSCGGDRLTYGQLDELSGSLSERLTAAGCGAGTLVAVLVDRSAESVPALLGVMRSGAAYVPIDVTYPQERISYILRDAGARVVVGSKQGLTRLEDEQNYVLIDRSLASPGTQAAPPAPPAPPGPGDLAYVIYTSGSTGEPKGVMVTHRALSTSTAARAVMEARAGRPGRYLVLAPLSFDASGGGLYWTLTRGGEVRLPTDRELQDPRQLKEMIEGESITHVDGVPSQYAILLDLCDGPLASVTACVLAGETLPPDLVRRHFGVNPQAVLFNEYGPTEGTVWCTAHMCTEADALGRSVPIGRPVPNYRVYLLDGHGELVPPGLPGELCIGGPGVARGYLGRPGLTAARFVPDPFSGAVGARLYRTGDRARHRADGSIEFLGRGDDQVKIRGFRVELGEIEDALRGHPAVADAAVLAVPAAAGDTRLAAYIIPARGHLVTRQTLTTRLARQLPDYMVPSSFTILDEFPLTPHGKIDFEALPAPAPMAIEADHIEPRTPTEHEVAGLFAEILDITQVGALANFFEIGGNSLLAARLLARMSRAFDVSISVFEIFTTPTVEGIAAKVDSALAATDGEASDEAKAALDLAELDAESQLDPDIDPAGLPRVDLAEIRDVLVTGATGYIGAFIVDELLRRTDFTVHCLVRADGEGSARQKLEERLRMFRIDTAPYRDRVRVVVGDLTEPLLGLTRRQFERLSHSVDAIYHSGANVNFMYPYDALKSANVQGTAELLRLACAGKVKPFNFLSSMDVYLASAAPRPFLECEPPKVPVRIPSGYPRSKWVAERLVEIAGDRGLPVAIYRPWQVLSHSRTGASHSTDYLLVSLKGFLDLGILPGSTDIINAAPVDYVASSIVYISAQPESYGKIFHLGNLNPVTPNVTYDWVRSFGYKPKTIDREEAREQALAVDPSHPLFPITPIISSTRGMEHPALSIRVQQSLDPQVECANTLKALEGSDIVCPPMNEELAHACFAYLVDIGFLPEPERFSGAAR